MGYHEDRFIEYLGEQDGQLGASPGDATRRLRRLAEQVEKEKRCTMVVKRKPVLLRRGDVANIPYKFYVGARHIALDPEGASQYGHTDLQAAIDHAVRNCEETGEDQIVVQIVRRVRVKAAPVVVESVR